MNSIQTIMNEYEEIREKNRRELEKRKKELYSKLPRLKEIDDEMVSLGINITKAVLMNGEDKEKLLEELHKKQTDLKIEKAEILTANNYPKDYLQMKYNCNKCKDTGYIGLERCGCLMQKLIAYQYKQFKLAHRISKENFDNFNINYYSSKSVDGGISPRENMEHIFMECIKYTKDFDRHNKNLLFIGRPGLGKTFLCNSIAKDLLDMGKSVIYQSAPDLVDLVRKYKFDFDNEEAEDEALRDIYECDLLIIDDLGTELGTQFSGLVIYNILNKRLLENKKMIISTNLDVDEIIKTYSERVSSRIFGNFLMYEFFGEDIRLKLQNII
ncbi:ATP-binding protein [Lutispora thermophila]|uniref:DNA replication protein DnaC n=1 Tax=Lutispora thermophila DSM 19022 TaxID=1122184 RepID=A0A1M6GVC2_9FIRM|nr:ATP-binding protein [Lutispora thermophila]SHJ13889.1 DNA replication protein DnaC [Lutispora thermophila DSM 19022]